MRLISLTIFALACFAQTVVEPEFADIFYRLDGTALVPLERQSATNYRASGLNTKVVTELPDMKSAIRLRSGMPLEFVVRSASPNVDPAEFYFLRPLEVKKNKRQLVVVTTQVGFFNAKTNTGATNLPLTFAKYGTASIKVTVGPLPSGEYALGHVGGQAVFCFGVD